ncbi:MAG: FadR/GntR family transcriptional regulator [Leucobacter sp.]
MTLTPTNAPSADAAGLDRFQNEEFLTTFFKDPTLGQVMSQLLQLNVGAALPGERDLAEQLGISRTALRDRIARLSSLGIVTKREREKSVFSGVHPDALGDVLLLGLLSVNFDIYSLVSLRKSLEMQAVIILTTQQGKFDLSRAKAGLDLLTHAKLGEDIVHGDTEFHLGILEAAGLTGLMFFWRALDQVFKVTHDSIDYAHDIDTFICKHEEYYAALRDRDLRLAIEKADAHFTWLIELLQRKGF